jgi:hypothetical protein
MLTKRRLPSTKIETAANQNDCCRQPGKVPPSTKRNTAVNKNNTAVNQEKYRRQ